MVIPLVLKIKAVLQIAAPTKVDAAVGYDCLGVSATAGSGTCSSRPATDAWQGERFDAGLMLNVKVGSKVPMILTYMLSQR